MLKDLSACEHAQAGKKHFIYVVFTYRSGEEKKRREKKSKQ